MNTKKSLLNTPPDPTPNTELSVNGTAVPARLDGWVCDNNNQNCTIHNTTADLDVKHQARPYTAKPYEKDMSNPFYRYDPDQCILCGRCVEACQNVQVNETLTIAWESPHPRVL